MCWKRLTQGALTDVITVNTLIKECYTTITSQRAVPALHLRWRQSFIVLDVAPTLMLSVFLVNVLNCDSHKKITLLYHTILSGIVPRVVSGSSQGTDATIRCLGFSKHWCTAGASFPCPLATSLPTNFPSKQTVHIQKKATYEKGSTCLWCVTVWLRRGSNAASLRFDGSVVCNGERRFQSDAQNTRLPLREKLNWLLTRHWFAWLHSQLELQSFLLVMDPQVKGSLWFWVPLVRFWTQVH